MTTIKDDIRQTSMFTMNGLMDPRLSENTKSSVNTPAVFQAVIHQIRKFFLNKNTSVG